MSELSVSAGRVVFTIEDSPAFWLQPLDACDSFRAKKRLDSGQVNKN